ncbi:MAG: hypothetical protein M1813_008720 [Trichoglossum hirsutum]|nr:MAG: hypothetical protein M1813_008720 [Trichoglossum hirsutum]
MSFPFQRLPAEIRNRIYMYHLCFPDKILLFRKHLAIDAIGFCIAPDGSTRPCRCTPSVLEIRLVCRQFNDEATHIFYRWNHFELYRTHDLWSFLLPLKSDITLRHSCLSLIREISVCHQGSMARLAFRLLQHVGSLRKLHICIAFQTSKEKYINKADILFGLDPLRKLRGVEIDFVRCLPCSGANQDLNRPFNHKWDEILGGLNERITKSSKEKAR